MRYIFLCNFHSNIFRELHSRHTQKQGQVFVYCPLLLSYVNQNLYILTYFSKIEVHERQF